MSTMKWCDGGDHPFSANQIGSQSINASIVVQKPDGTLDSPARQFDLCKDHAIGSVNQGADSKPEPRMIDPSEGPE